jgi:hypothetical protein
VHFSIFMVHRGIMAIPIPMLGIIPVMPHVWPIEGIPLDIPMLPIIVPRSIIIALDIETHTFLSRATAKPKTAKAVVGSAQTPCRWTICAPLVIQSARQSEKNCLPRFGSTHAQHYLVYRLSNELQVLFLQIYAR